MTCHIGMYESVGPVVLLLLFDKWVKIKVFFFNKNRVKSIG